MSGEDEIAKALRRAYGAVDDSLADSGDDVLAHLRKITSVPYPPASRPGAPPAKRSGQLNRGFRKRVEGTVLHIYNTAPHFKWVEEGTSKMKARPSLSTITRGMLSRTVRTNLARDIVRAERKRS